MSEQVVYSERVGGDHDPNCDACKRLIAHTRHVTIPANNDAHIANLEWRVVEAAVKWRTVYDAESRYGLERAIDALIAAREEGGHQ